jgi:EAL domain-containing protein (putative c-di-GMP-specific phosphodiesterase class I)/GGDEF domain-containing protein
MRDHALFSGRRRPPPASRPHALVLLGFDNVAALESLFCEAIGDEVMQAVEARVARVVREGDRVWRAGHRRIAVAARGVDRATLSGFVARLQAAVAHDAIATSHGPVAVTVAAGCVVTEDPDEEARLSAARHALMEAMGSGVGCIRFAEETGGAERERRHAVAAAQLAMGAIRNGELMVAFQPVVSAAGENHAAFHECLVRIHDPAGRLVAAGEFMPAMERLGLAPLIDRHVLILALDTLRRQPGIRLSINIFPQTMQDAQWMMIFDEGTREDPSLAERLIIEITETAAMLDPARTRAFIERLRDRGAAFALDDFGMGYTSFGSLRDFRFDIIKIDGSFVTDVTSNPDSRFFVSKLVEIGRHFEMMTAAECVQGAAEARILRDLGVEYFQGFYFGTPSLILAPEKAPHPEILSAG